MTQIYENIQSIRKEQNFYLTEGACFKPTEKGMFVKNASKFDMTIYTVRDRTYDEFKDEILVPFKDSYSSSEFVIIGPIEEKEYILNFQKCINTPGPMEQLTNVDQLKTDTDNLLTTIKTVIQKISDVNKNTEKEGWLKTMVRIIVSQGGFISQLNKMNDCFVASKDSNAKLAQKLLNSFKP